LSFLLDLPGNLACILRHPDIRDAKIGGLQTLLPHLPPLIEQPAFGQLRIADELSGLTVSCRILNEVPRDFGCTSWASRAGALRASAFDMSSFTPAAHAGAREASCAHFGVCFWGFNPKPE